jgi:hypothetical protein
VNCKSFDEALKLQNTLKNEPKNEPTKVNKTDKAKLEKFKAFLNLLPK